VSLSLLDERVSHTRSSFSLSLARRSLSAGVKSSSAGERDGLRGMISWRLRASVERWQVNLSDCIA
jgi:hypothetical protein